MSNTHLVSWNVNGIRAIMKKIFSKISLIKPRCYAFRNKAQPQDAQRAFSVIEGYTVYVNSSKSKKGYSGTTILSKEKPLR